jgi:hypothetical protein
LSLFSLLLLNSHSDGLGCAFLVNIYRPTVQNFGVFFRELGDLDKLNIFLVLIYGNLLWVFTCSWKTTWQAIEGAFFWAHELVNRDYLHSRLGIVASYKVKLRVKSELSSKDYMSTILRKLQ